MQKILILGGNGYIGSQLINDYANYYKITSVDLVGTVIAKATG